MMYLMSPFPQLISTNSNFSSQKYENTRKNAQFYHIEYSIEIDPSTESERVIYMLPIKNMELDKASRATENWNGFGAPGPNQEAIDKAKRAQGILHKEYFFDYHISPSADGGIAFTFRKDDKLTDIEFDNDGSIWVATSSRSENLIVDEFQNDNNALNEAIEKIREYIEL